MIKNLTLATTENGINAYLREVQSIPMLSAAEEYMLAKRYQEHGDLPSAHKLVTSHLRFVAKIAFKYRGYGLPIGEVISEGNIGLMQAVKKFNPDKGFRLATYAMWWIKAAIQEYVLRSWSLVRIGTTTNQKKLFFNLKKLKNKLQSLEQKNLTNEQISAIANELQVSESDVVSMDSRLAGDSSLNTPVRNLDSQSIELQDKIADETNSPEQNLIESDELLYKRRLLQTAVAALNDREQIIFKSRKLQDPASTLEELANQFNISRERVRQIEERSLQKIQQYINANHDVTAIAALPKPN